MKLFPIICKCCNHDIVCWIWNFSVRVTPLLIVISNGCSSQILQKIERMCVKVSSQRPLGTLLGHVFIIISLTKWTFVGSNIRQNPAYAFNVHKTIRFHKGITQPPSITDIVAEDVLLRWDLYRGILFNLTLKNYGGLDEVVLEVTGEIDSGLRHQETDVNIRVHIRPDVEVTFSILTIASPLLSVLYPIAGRAISRGGNTTIYGNFYGYLLENRTNLERSVVGYIEFFDNALILDFLDKYQDNSRLNLPNSLSYVILYWERDIQTTKEISDDCDTRGTCKADDDRYLSQDVLSYVPIIPAGSRRGGNSPKLCNIHVYADYSILDLYEDDAVVLANVLRDYIMRASDMFSLQDFNDDGLPDNIRFHMKWIEIIAYDEGNDTTTRGNKTAYLDSFWLRNQTSPAFCASLHFVWDQTMEETHFAMSPWLKINGSMRTRGGACRSATESPGYNTGVINLMKNDKTLAEKTVILTIMHVMSHLFGAEHDDVNVKCDPPDRSENGYYLMSSIPVDGSKPNHHRLSPCSRRSINAAIQARVFDGCLEDKGHLTCGNGYLEPWEECDCRLASAPMTCVPSISPCCTQWNGEDWTFERLCIDIMNGNRELETCTSQYDVKFACCNERICKFMEAGERCSMMFDALSEEEKACQIRDDLGSCDGRSPVCKGEYVRDGTSCMERSDMTCKRGICRVQLCRENGMRDCTCPEEGNKRCLVCCIPSDNSACRPLNETLTSLPQGTNTWLEPAGTPCSYDGGTCSRDGICIRHETNQSPQTTAITTRPTFTTTTSTIMTTTIAELTGEERESESTTPKQEPEPTTQDPDFPKEADGSVTIKCSLNRKQLLAGCVFLQLLVLIYLTVDVLNFIVTCKNREVVFRI